MFKLKKLLAGVLGAAMVLSSMSMTAFATGNDTITQDKGSLTIKKRETDEKGDLIAGVTFKMYKLADITQTVTKGVVDTQVTPVTNFPTKPGKNFSKGDLERIAEGTASTKEWEDLTAIVDLDAPELTAAYTATTGDSGDNLGVAKFENVALGIYAVKETDAPSYVVSKSANFIVSIPQTDPNGGNWVYDITAEPKNAVSRGGITLHKAGKVGNGSETNLEGVQFVLQQKGSDSTWTAVAGVQENQLTTDASGNITLTNLAPGTYRFVEKSLGNNGGYILDASAVYEFELKINSTDSKTHVWYDANNDGTKEDKGDTATAGFIINVLNEKPTLEKTVKDGNTYDNETDANIGDTVEWKVEASVPSKIAKMEKYTLTDTMSEGLTWVSEADAALTVTSDKNIILEKNTDYTLTVPADGTTGGTWTITFTAAGKTKLANNGSPATLITVKFSTLLNENAKIANVGGAGNLNTAGLIYSNNIVPDSDLYPDQPRDPKEEKIEDQATVYTFGISVEKIDGNNQATKLKDVTFDLYKYTGNKTEGVTETDLTEKISVALVEGKYIVNAGGNATLTTDANGNIVVHGLKNGTYYLVETKTNAGYNLLKEPVKVQIAVEYTTKTQTTTITDVDGNVTSTTVTTKTFTGGESNNGIIKTTVKNNKGFELPTTGGMGSAIFIIGGIALALAGLMLILNSRKKTVAK